MVVIPEQGSATVSLADAARILGISRSTAYELDARGKFPVRVLKIGSRRKVARVHLEQFLLGEDAA